MLVRDYQLIQEFDVVFERKIVIYGAGDWGRKIYGILTQLNVNVAHIVTTKKEEHQEFDVELLDTIADKINTNEFMIIISSYNYHEEMVNKLDTLDFGANSGVYVCTAFGFLTALFLNTDNNNIPLNYRENIKFAIKCSVENDHYIKKYLFYDATPVSLFVTNPILVWTLGKVASLTVANSIGKFKEVMHTHNLTDFLKQYNGIPKMKNLLQTRKTKIISLVRNPYLHDLSVFFQNQDYSISHLLVFLYKYNEMEMSNDYCKICSDFLDRKIMENGDRLSWFDHQIKYVTDIDVFSSPFDKEAGYAIYRKGNIELLLIKMEKLNSLESVIGDFIGIKNFHLENKNESRRKIYHYLYAYLRKNIIFTQRYREFYLNSEKTLHFYSREELSRILEEFQL